MKTKILLSLVLPIILLAILAGNALAAEKPRVLPGDGAEVPEKFVAPSPVMYEGGMQPDCEDINQDPGVVVIQHDSWGITCGDEQQIGSMGRMIAVGPGGYRHMVFQESGCYPPPPPEYVSYNCKDPWDVWCCEPERIDGGYEIKAGYPNIDLLHDGEAVVTYHRTAEPPPNPIWYSTLAVQDEGYPCTPYFTNKYDLPDDLQGYEPGMFPKLGIVYVAIQDTDYIHIVMTEGRSGQGDLRLGYMRCHLIAGGNLLCETPLGQAGVVSPQVRPPNVACVQGIDCFPIAYFGETAPGSGEYPNNISVVVATSPVSQKVAIVFTNKSRPAANRYDNDVFYFESANNGIQWFPQWGGEWPPTEANGMLVNVTQYPETYPERAFTDVAACYDYNDSLHIVWNSCAYDPVTGIPPNNNANLMHWVNTDPPGIENATLVAPGYWDDGTVNCGEWNRTISKPSISAKNPIYHPGGDPDSIFLFCTWTQFDLGDNSLSGYTNGDIYAAVSNDAGLTWTRGYNLTNTQTPNCDTNECLSEHWSSLAENMYDGDLHIEYVCDRYAGAAIRDEGAWTWNDMMYLHLEQLPWQDMCGVDIKLIDPPGDRDAWHTPPLKVVPGEQRVIRMDLTGLYTLGGDYMITTDNPNVNCTNNCAGFLAPQQTIPVELTIYCTEEGFLTARIHVHYCIGTAEENTDTVMLHVVQSDDYYECPRDTLRTTIWKDNCKLRAWFCVNCEERVWDKRIYSEEKQQVIFSASSIVATSWQGDTVVGRQDFRDIRTGARDTIHHVVGIDPDQPECALQVVWSKNTFICANNLPPPNHQRWWWIDIHKQIFMWHDTLGLQCPNWKKEQIIKQMWIDYSEPPLWWPDQSPYTGHEDIYFGYFADVNAPDDSCWGANFAGYDFVRQMIWHRGLGPPAQYDNYFIGHAFTDRNGGVVAPLGCQDVLNRVFLWPNGGWGWKEGELYLLAATPGVNIHNPGAADDRTVVMTADMIPGGTGNFSSEYILIEAFIETGLADLQAHMDDTRAILIPYLDSLGVFAQCPICGDINEDGVINSADIVFLINYLFKPGSPEPSWPITRGDVNGDGVVNSADIVYMINYLFKNGDPPKCSGFGR